ncbi:MAG TPA: TolC family protein [Methylomirabilota bacterium]|jgi:TolC family type I secretion outer membrane protein|nr:TolC family protein [Methylomirabilota bacterium]HEV8676974.1 TolC family protein [Methylomirabilota bacterium]
MHLGPADDRAWLVGLLIVVALGAAAPGAAQPPPAPGQPGPAREAPAPGQVLSLPEAIALARRQHPTIRAAEQAVTASTARVPQAQSAYYPRLDWLSAAARSQFFSSTLNQGVRANSISTALQANLLIYDFGKTGALVDEARANVRVSETDLERIRELVVLNVRQAYLVLLQSRRLVRVADAGLARAELNLRSAQGFFDVGTKPKSDVTKAEVEVANARVTVIRARNQVRLAETTLANALGLEATTTVEIQDILGFEPVTLDAAGLLTEALKNRPELIQALARFDAARAQLAGARARFWPTLNAAGFYGYSTPDDPPLHENWSIGIQLSWNLFEGFFTVTRIRETQALVEVARANYDAFELQVRLEVEQAYISVVEAAERVAATEKAVESATENLRLAQGRYDAGVGTILDLTDAQLALTTAEADQVRALTDHKLGLAALDRAVGRP